MEFIGKKKVYINGYIKISASKNSFEKYKNYLEVSKIIHVE
jgi:hypothetical protein